MTTHREKAIAITADLDLSDLHRNILVDRIVMGLQGAWSDGYTAATQMSLKFHGYAPGDSRRWHFDWTGVAL